MSILTTPPNGSSTEQVDAVYKQIPSPAKAANPVARYLDSALSSLSPEARIIYLFAGVVCLLLGTTMVVQGINFTIPDSAIPAALAITLIPVPCYITGLVLKVVRGDSK